MYYDLSIQNRDSTDDRVTFDAARAIKKYKVGIKCATIEPKQATVREFNLKRMWRSPSGTIRNYLGGTVFREPILINNIPRSRWWSKPIIVGRHHFGDQYIAPGFHVPGPGKFEIVYTPEDGGEKQKVEVFNLKTPGIILGMYETDNSIAQFAHDCFKHALERNYPMFLSTKNTILKTLDDRYQEIFDEVYNENYRNDFATRGL